MPQTPDDAGVNIIAEQGQSSEKASANTELANLFTAAMAPFVGQMTKLNENVSLLLSGRDLESEEDGETASAEAVEDSDHEGVDMEASLPAVLDSKTTDKAAPRTGDAFFTRARSRSLGERANLPASSRRSGGHFQRAFVRKDAR